MSQQCQVERPINSTKWQSEEEQLQLPPCTKDEMVMTHWAVGVFDRYIFDHMQTIFNN